MLVQLPLDVTVYFVEVDRKGKLLVCSVRHLVFCSLLFSCQYILLLFSISSSVCLSSPYCVGGQMVANLLKMQGMEESDDLAYAVSPR